MPALRRHIKQLVYALIFSFLLALPIFFVIFPALVNLRLPGRPAPPSADAIKVESVSTIPHSGNVDIIARIRNPNPRAGVSSFPVTFVLKDSSGAQISRLARSTYLLPGSLNYVAALAVPLNAALAEAIVEIPPDPPFIILPETFSAPTFNSFLRERTTRPSESGPVEIQKGVVTNTSTLSWQRVDITAVAFDSNDNIVGIGQTFIGRFKVGEQREFTVEWPASPTPVQRVIILPATNIFRPDNILQETGDPANLR